MLRDDSAGRDNARYLYVCGQLPEYGPFSYIYKSTSRTICFEPIYVQVFSNIYILNAFTEKPYSKLMRHNVVYNPITTPSHATSHDR